MQPGRGAGRTRNRPWAVRQFDKDTAHLFDFLVRPNQMFVTEKVTKTQFPSFSLRLDASVEGPKLSSQLVGRVASHPERFLVSHFLPRWADRGLAESTSREHGKQFCC